MSVLSTIRAMRIEMKTLKEGIGVEGLASFYKDRESKIQDHKPSMFKDSRDA